MEGRYPQGLLLALTNCTDPSKEEEFNAWYNHMHVPDVTAPGIFRHALRFVNTDLSSQAGQYVATYETNGEDVSKAMRCLINYAREVEEVRDGIFAEIRCLNCG